MGMSLIWNNPVPPLLVLSHLALLEHAAMVPDATVFFFACRLAVRTDNVHIAAPWIVCLTCLSRGSSCLSKWPFKQEHVCFLQEKNSRKKKAIQVIFSPSTSISPFLDLHCPSWGMQHRCPCHCLHCNTPAGSWQQPVLGNPDSQH
ncbi:hypothetical protein J3F84DRAFT_385744 [Trichoderma pleuroticola]